MLTLSWLPAGTAAILPPAEYLIVNKKRQNGLSVHRTDKANPLPANFRCIVGTTARELPKFFVNYRQ